MKISIKFYDKYLVVSCQKHTSKMGKNDEEINKNLIGNISRQKVVDKKMIGKVK